MFGPSGAGDGVNGVKKFCYPCVRTTVAFVSGPCSPQSRVEEEYRDNRAWRDAESGDPRTNGIRDFLQEKSPSSESEDYIDGLSQV